MINENCICGNIKEKREDKLCLECNKELFRLQARGLK